MKTSIRAARFISSRRCRRINSSSKASTSADRSRKNKASFTLDFDRRDITENAFILATTLGSNLNPLTVNQGIVTPQTRMTITPRLDYTINEKNTLVVRYQNTRIGQDDNGVGSYNLAVPGVQHHGPGKYGSADGDGGAERED